MERLIPAYDAPGYQVAPLAGVVISPKGHVCRTRNNGYIQVSNRSRGMTRRAHRMVWESVHGPIPDGLEINHKNGVRADNRIENLELVTSTGNKQHAYRTGLAKAAGERNGRARLTEAQVSEIKEQRRRGERRASIAESFGISKAHVTQISSGQRWTAESARQRREQRAVQSWD
ncbi:MAG: HNH endonuclease [Chloroflexi bacterium]|nr:HNH endonuclease [Chloroflexota bacterium]